MVDAILERNPEVAFKSPIDMDRVSHCCLVHLEAQSCVVIVQYSCIHIMFIRLQLIHWGCSGASGSWSADGLGTWRAAAVDGIRVLFVVVLS